MIFELIIRKGKDNWYLAHDPSEQFYGDGKTEEEARNNWEEKVYKHAIRFNKYMNYQRRVSE